MEPLDRPFSSAGRFEAWEREMRSRIAGVLTRLREHSTTADAQGEEFRLRTEELLARVRRPLLSSPVQSPIQSSASEATTADAQVEEGRQNQEIDPPLRSPPVQSPIQSSASEATTADADAQGEEGRLNQEIDDGVVESVKRKNAHSIAKALDVEEPDATTVKVKESTGNYFDCNICLEMAKDPVLTCCGHLFCWPCFYQVSYAYLNARECPVCKGEVAETGIIPIYGNGSASDDSQMELNEAGLTIPPRPQAPRVESIRQQLISHRASSTTTESYIHSHQTGGSNPRRESLTPDVAVTNSATAASVSPLSRNVDNIAAIGSEIQTTDSNARISMFYPSSNGRRRNDVSRPQPESLTPDVAVTNSAAAAASVSPLRRNLDNIAAIDSEIQSIDNFPLISLFYPSSNDRRRNDVSRPQPENLTPDVAVTNSTAAVSPLIRNLDNIAAMTSEIQSTDDIPRIGMFCPSSNGRRRNDVARQDPSEPRTRRRLR